MILKQISVFIENKPGRLAEITGIIAGQNINMRALVLAESTNSGILRIIVDEPEKVESFLKAHDMTCSINKVISVFVDDKAGGLAGMLKILADNSIAIKYMYAVVIERGKACMILRISEEFRAKAVEILKNAGYEGLNIK